MHRPAAKSDPVHGLHADPRPMVPTARVESPRPPCILIVEDDPFIAIDMEDSFLEAGFEVMGPFAQPSQAIVALLERTPDVAALDYRLGGTTSTAIAEVLDSHNVPVVMVTSSGPEMRRSGTLGERELFPKPCDMDRLINRTLELASRDLAA